MRTPVVQSVSNMHRSLNPSTVRVFGIRSNRRTSWGVRIAAGNATVGARELDDVTRIARDAPRFVKEPEQREDALQVVCLAARRDLFTGAGVRVIEEVSLVIGHDRGRDLGQFHPAIAHDVSSLQERPKRD